MKVVLDTNIFVSGIFWIGDSNKIIKLWKEGKLVLFTSREIINEFIKVMKDFKIKLPDNLIKEWVDLVTNNSILVEPKARFDIIKEDLSDNKFLDCAHEGKVNYIISNDKHLLKLKDFKGIKIVKPKDFMNTI